MGRHINEWRPPLTTLHHAVTVLEVISEIAIGKITFVVCDVCVRVGVFIGSVAYHCHFKFLP
jgi:hypothetical protein